MIHITHQTKKTDNSGKTKTIYHFKCFCNHKANSRRAIFNHLKDVHGYSTTDITLLLNDLQKVFNQNQNSLKKWLLI